MNFRVLLISLMTALAAVGCQSKEKAAQVSAPQRIVSVTITGDVLLGALVDSSRVQAISALADDSGIHEAAGVFPTKPRVSSDLEKILSLRPDLVLLGSFHDPAFLSAVQAAGLSVEILESPNSLAKVREYIQRVSRRLGEGPGGDSLVAWMDSVLAVSEQKANACAEHPRVLFWSEGYTAGDSSTVGELIRRMGGKNAAVELGIHGSEPIALEDVVRLSPDWIIRGSWSADGGNKPLPPAMQGLPAVKAGQVGLLPSKLLLSTSHRVALVAEPLRKLIQSGCP